MDWCYHDETVNICEFIKFSGCNTSVLLHISIVKNDLHVMCQYTPSIAFSVVFSLTVTTPILMIFGILRLFEVQITNMKEFCSQIISTSTKFLHLAILYHNTLLFNQQSYIIIIIN